MRAVLLFGVVQNTWEICLSRCEGREWSAFAILEICLRVAFLESDVCSRITTFGVCCGVSSYRRVASGIVV